MLAPWFRLLLGRFGFYAGVADRVKPFVTPPFVIIIYIKPLAFMRLCGCMVRAEVR